MRWATVATLDALHHTAQKRVFGRINGAFIAMSAGKCRQAPAQGDRLQVAGLVRDRERSHRSCLAGGRPKLRNSTDPPRRPAGVVSAGAKMYCETIGSREEVQRDGSCGSDNCRLSDDEGFCPKSLLRPKRDTKCADFSSKRRLANRRLKFRTVLPEFTALENKSPRETNLGSGAVHSVNSFGV